MKNPFKSKNQKQNPAPRPLPEIEKEAQQLLAHVASSQYQAYVHNKNVETINERLVSVNQEADARKRLDAEVAKELAKQKEVEDAVGVITKSGAV